MIIVVTTGKSLAITILVVVLVVFTCFKGTTVDSGNQELVTCMFYLDENLRKYTLPTPLVVFEESLRKILPSSSKLFAIKRNVSEVVLSSPQECSELIDQVQACVEYTPSCNSLDPYDFGAMIELVEVGSVVERYLGLTEGCWLFSTEITSDKIRECMSDMTERYQKLPIPPEMIEYEKKLRALLPRGGRLYDFGRKIPQHELKIPKACNIFSRKVDSVFNVVKSCAELGIPDRWLLLNSVHQGSLIERRVGLSMACRSYEMP